jgi:hypothetical protein
MKKILRLSLTLMLMCWSAASAEIPTASRDAASARIDDKAEQTSQSTASTKIDDQNQETLPKENLKSKSIEPASVRNPGAAIISSDGRTAQEFLAEKKLLKKKKDISAIPREGAKYNGPATMPYWYTPESITDIILTEGFENGGRIPSGWSDCCNHQNKWDYDGGNPDYGPPAPHGGQYAAFFDVYNYSYGTTDTLISPSMDLSIHSGSYAIAFWYWDAPDPEGIQDSITLFVSEGGVDTYLGKLPQSVPVWTQLVYTFNSTSSSVKIKFAGFSCGGSTDPYIDDFIVADFIDVGRCCYGDPANPSCDDLSQAECEALNGNWLYGATCASDTCVPYILGDNCSAPFEITSFPYTDTRNTGDFTNDVNPEYIGGDVVYRFTITEPMFMDIGLCNTEVPFSTYMGVWREGNCGAIGNFDIWCEWGGCPAYWELASIPEGIFAAGTYYFYIEPSWNATSDGIYTLDVTAQPANPVIDFQVTAPGQWTGNTCGAGNDCGLNASEDHIYEVTIPYNGSWLFALCNSPTVWDTYMSIGTSYCSADIADNDDGCGNPGYYLSRIVVPLTAGVYYVTVEGLFGGGCGPYTLDIIEAPPPPWNDDCADVNPADYPLSDGVPIVYTGDNSNATQDCPTNGISEVWIPFSTSECMDVTINFCGTNPSPGWANITLNTDCPCGEAIWSDAYNWTDCVDGNWTLHFYNLPAGNYYYPLNADLTWDPTGPYTLTVIGTICQPPPENDNCANATPIGNVENLPWSTRSASFDGSGNCMYSANIWYLYTADCDGMGFFSLCGSELDTKIAVYDGATCDSLPAELACNDDVCGWQSQVIIPVIAGNQYLIEVGGYDTNVGDGFLTVACAPPPPNDNCVNVNPADYPLSDGVPVVYEGHNIGATNDCNSLDWAEVWIPFSTDNCMDVTINSCGTNPALATLGLWLFSDCPCGDHIVANSYNGDECGDGNWTARFYDLPPGNYYYPLYSDSAQGFYTITVTGTVCPPPPPNLCDAEGLIYGNGAPSDPASAYASQCDPVYPFAAGLADDFVLPGAGAVTIGSVVAYIGFWNHSPVATPENLTGMMITIYSDNAGSPAGKPISGDPNCAHEELMEGGIVSSQFVSPDNFIYNRWTWDVWQIECTLAPVELTAGTTYWLEIAPVLPDFVNFGQSGLANTNGTTGAGAMLIFPLVPGYEQWAILDPPIDVAFCFNVQGASCAYVVGDINGNGAANGIDVTYGVSYFKGGDPPPIICLDCPGPGQTMYAGGDVNGNCTFNGIDITFYVGYLKGSQPALLFCSDCPPANPNPPSPAVAPAFGRPIRKGNIE